MKTKRTHCLKKDLIGMRVFPTLSPFIYPHYKNMKKILLALSLAAVSAVTVADIPESNGKGEYKVFTGYSKGKAIIGDKEKHRYQA